MAISPYVPSASEAAILALVAKLCDLPGVSVQRNTPLDAAMTIPPHGLIIVRDGEPGEPEITLSPVTYQYDHLAEVEVLYSAPRRVLDQQFDALRQKVGQALLADRRLGGAVMWVEPVAAVALDIAALMEVPTKAASLPVRLVYLTSNPLN
jgi:hypothetical protein